jgi:hypothetical protein
MALRRLRLIIPMVLVLVLGAYLHEAVRGETAVRRLSRRRLTLWNGLL